MAEQLGHPVIKVFNNLMADTWVHGGTASWRQPPATPVYRTEPTAPGPGSRQVPCPARCLPCATR